MEYRRKTKSLPNCQNYAPAGKCPLHPHPHKSKSLVGYGLSVWLCWHDKIELNSLTAGNIERHKRRNANWKLKRGGKHKQRWTLSFFAVFNKMPHSMAFISEISDYPCNSPRKESASIVELHQVLMKSKPWFLWYLSPPLVLPLIHKFIWLFVPLWTLVVCALRNIYPPCQATLCGEGNYIYKWDSMIIFICYVITKHKF